MINPTSEDEGPRRGGEGGVVCEDESVRDDDVIFVVETGQ